MKHSLFWGGAGALLIAAGSPASAQSMPEMAAAPDRDSATAAAMSGAQTGGPVPASALVSGQEEAANGGAVADIVVTAQRRSESLQRVPLAITAVTSSELARGGIRDLQGIAAVVPNLNLGQQLGVAKVALRGIGLENLSPGAEGSIAFHVDGVFASRSITALSSFYDVEQVEVLRGPQGTLYGRNATGGSINIATREPTKELSGYVTGTVGNYGRYGTEGAIGGALISDVLLARVAFQTDDRDGFGKNTVTGRDIDNLRTRSVRGKLLFKPVDRLSFELTGDYHRERDRGGGYHYLGSAGFTAPGVPLTPIGLQLGGTSPDNRRDISSDADPRNRVEFWGVSGKLTYDLGGDTELRSLTAFRRTDYTTTTDLDATSVRLASPTQSEHDKQFSQELQLSGRSSQLNWLLGLFYFNENDRGSLAIPLNNLLVGFPPPGEFVQGFFSGGRIETDAWALFGQASYRVVDKLRITLGGRYSSEKKSDFDRSAFDVFTPYNPTLPYAGATLNQDASFHSFTPRIALDYQWTPDVLLYASWSRGFKSGTYNLGSLRPAVQPEKVSAFEGGIKSTWLDRRLRLNLAGFYYDYKDLQVGKVVGQTLRLENAATATIYGVEAELQASLSSRLNLNANASWLHARFDRYVSADPARPFGDGTTLDPGTGALAFDLAGNSLSQSPDFTFFVGGEYQLPTSVGRVSLRGEVAWRDRVYYTPFNVKAVSQSANAKVNMFLNWASRNERQSGSLFVKNLTNKTTVGNSYVGSALVGFPVIGYLEEPRTYGFTISTKF